MANLNDGVGKKIVEALKKQSTGEVDTPLSQPVQEEEQFNTGLGIDISALDSLQPSDISTSAPVEDFSNKQIPNFDEFFNDEELSNLSEQKSSFSDFMAQPEKTEDVAEMPSNIIILKKLISQLPNGVTRHTGAQIIKQTMEALGISMKSVLNEAQEVQNNLQVSSKECQMMIQEYKRKIVGLEKQVQNYQKQYNALNDLISLFIQTTK